MSDPYAQRNLARGLEQTRVIERSPLYLPWTQRVLNPFPLASSGNPWGDMGQPWAVSILAFYASVFVVTTNNGTNFWTIDLLDTATSTVLASVSTAAIAANVYTRLVDTTVTAPGATNPALFIRPTATLSPGAIYIVPALALLRTGN